MTGVKRQTLALCGALLLTLLTGSPSSQGHEIRPALLELTQLTATEWRLRFRQPLQRPDEIGARQQELAAAPAVDDSVVLSCSGDELHAEVSLPATTLEEVPVALLQGLKQLHRGVRDFHNCGCG